MSGRWLKVLISRSNWMLSFDYINIEIYMFFQDTKWLKHSVDLFQWSWVNGWDGACGGVWWSNCPTSLYKDSITIVQLMHLSSKLAYLFPKNDTYLLKAEEVWNWFFSFDDGYGLMSDKYLVSTGAIPEKCCNSSSTDPFAKCHNSKIPGTSYNQGLLMSSSAYLYRRTGNKTYLLVGMRALEAILTNYTTDEGILIDEPRSYQNFNGMCKGDISDPGSDYFSFEGIFMLHLSYFIDLLRENGSLPDETLQRVKNFVSKTSDAAWSRSAVFPPFSDICNSSPKKSSLIQYPRFHWWWGTDNVKQRIPPDTRILFHAPQIRCMLTSDRKSQIWNGLVGLEDKCQKKCLEYKTCSKYLYQTSQLVVPGLDCWILENTRNSNISCFQNDLNFNVGVKRPVGASCAGHCNNSAPINTSSGGVCYCDSQCAKQLDCCLDYVDLCLPQDTVPSCKGTCEKPLAQPIGGGGYCWCKSGCTPWYTDNNSDGSCCPDYAEQCKNITVPPCLDGRSQGSAINLFLAHAKISKIK